MANNNNNNYDNEADNDGCRLRELPRHRRSISQLIYNLDHDFNERNEGITNHGYQYDELNYNYMYGQFDATAASVNNMAENNTLQRADERSIVKSRETSEHNSTVDSINSVEQHDHSGCLPDFQFSMIEAEYDEGLIIPDSLTILSIGGDKPVLVERKEGTDDDEFDEDDVELRRLTVIPFTRLYGPSVKFTSFQRKVFMPGIEIQVRFIDTERSVTTHLLNPNLYTIELTHGPFTWTIKRRYKHFSSLHQQLSIFRASLNIPFPIRSHKEKRATIKNAAAIQMADENRIKELQKSASFKTALSNGNSVSSRTAGPSNMQTMHMDPLNTAERGSRRKKRKKRKLPRFPQRPESLVTVEAMPERIQQLEDYLYNLLNISLYRNHHETLNFVEVSNVSFVDGLGIKGKEGAILKRTGSTRPGQAGCNFFGCFQQKCCVRCNYFCSDVVCGSWRSRWFFVKETCFGYIRPSDGVIRAVILFDMGFDVSTGIYQTGMRKGLQILTNNRHIVLKCWTRRKCKEWNDYLKQTANTTARDFTMPNPHNSYAPERSDITAQWFVDGSSYMSAVADALEAATEEIYITDWWLSPEIYMKRPAVDGDYWRLDKILLRKAKDGVKVFVLLFKEVEMALGINSYYSKQRLVNLHENIKVMRHPDHAKVGVFFWAHHEKIVVVDQTYAFLGGVDLCYGRWDDYRHRLTDLGSITTSSASGSTRRPGGFFNREEVDSAFGSSKSSRNINNELHKSEQELERLQMETTSKNTLELPVLIPGDKLMIPTPYSNNGDNIDLEGLKLNTPEMERKNMLKNLKDNAMKKGKDLVNRLTVNEGDKTPEIIKDPKQLVFSIPEIEEGRKGGFEDPTPFQTQILDDYYGQAKYWFGKDYSNFIMKDWMNLDAPFVDMIDRTTTPRMPWHDVAICVVGAAARDVARHFIQRWNAMKLEKSRENLSFPYLMPKSYQQIKLNPNITLKRTHRVSCQLLRSVSSWSCGFIEQDLVEQSIHDAYIQTITKAQHYIYIENQFFITMQLGAAASLGQVRNQIGEALFKRIVRAHKERKTFRVYVIMPLLPGFEGDVGGNSGIAVRAITHWNYASISRGRSAILVRLKEVGIENPGEYISFHALRTHSQLNNVPITELIYVHSKLLIADDRVVICGSANINDRSMIGKRDSEIAAIITDNEFEDGRMNGKKYPSGVFAGRLRKFLFKEHLGLLDPDAERMPIDIIDPVVDQFWNGMWKRISTRNTEIYDEVFKCIPNDKVKSLANLRKYQEEEPPLLKSDPDIASKRLLNIQGNLVDLPLEFLNKEVLTPPGTSKEGLIPTSVWT
ncbi:phospholipase D2 isoform X1 [Lucilia cuprina]|uniref:phospholipase D2 isoform X1 n=2 Tax=Lucilia cuprina TaxID=7375 RepID=UPI001F058B07|nr:phospholipase D2 isoform X1 [Lucilia cuprina]XP_046809878.1 phospholipase D2 isoform X1 [Lucilia cuprina]